MGSSTLLKHVFQSYFKFCIYPIPTIDCDTAIKHTEQSIYTYGDIHEK